mmetsp:Transcript_152910/g.488631  ORF Transcript_152910/g.488631 Transcript_152910/m.488631 type:complete len:233 (-) Transcript_152910:134-832(-)
MLRLTGPQLRRRRLRREHRASPPDRQFHPPALARTNLLLQKYCAGRGRRPLRGLWRRRRRRTSKWRGSHCSWRLRRHSSGRRIDIRRRSHWRGSHCIWRLRRHGSGRRIDILRSPPPPARGGRGRGNPHWRRGWHCRHEAGSAPGQSCSHRRAWRRRRRRQSRGGGDAARRRRAGGLSGIFVRGVAAHSCRPEVHITVQVQVFNIVGILLEFPFLLSGILLPTMFLLALLLQ